MFYTVEDVWVKWRLYENFVKENPTFFCTEIRLANWGRESMENKDKYSAQSKWQKKVGLKPYTFRTYDTITAAFREAFEKNGVSQSSVRSAYIVEYAKQAGIEVKKKE